MKFRIPVYTLTGALVLAIILWIYFRLPTAENDTVFEASVNRDCAPWDGTAYTISIPDQAGSVIVLSIWKSPGVRFPVTYSFPDSSGRVGTAVHQFALGSFQQLSGKITLQPFEIGSPVLGGFNFTSEDGKQFTGVFKAEWGNQSAFCG
ncbi:MAG TPA: hypothetical protein VFI68_02085 [Anaerolineales bacterium]|nr:hypothetical protein [Anaerolineales bacterium]